MPALETAGRYQDAVLWTEVGRDRYNNLKLGPPVELLTRWEDRRRQVIGADGTPVALEADVIIDRFVPPGSLMWKGKLADWNPDLKNELLVVAFFERVPDVNAREVQYGVSLTKYKQTLPT